MEILGWIVSFAGLGLTALVLWRGRYLHIIGRFPFFYSYLGCGFCGTFALFLIFRFRHGAYPYAYWLYFLLGIVVEFAVLVEISDHLFEPFPAIRQLGRALTIIILIGLGLIYILPTILYSHSRHSALLGFALRASLTKAVILGALLLAAHYYGLRLGKNVAGLILGFSIYLGVNIANFAADQLFYHLYDNILWVMSPIAYTLCLAVWLIALWDFVPTPSTRTVSPASRRDPEAVTFELARFNNELSKFLNK
ncbi:MAG TPA: hypothetical protein VEN79_14910 [Terriglobia bacterium]|nr:hypothetical protein [Terriglobia bacterium]